MRKIRNFYAFLYILSILIVRLRRNKSPTGKFFWEYSKRMPTVIGVLLRVTEQHRPIPIHTFRRTSSLVSWVKIQLVKRTNSESNTSHRQKEGFFSSFPFLKDLLFIFLIFTTCGKFRFSISPFCRIFADSYRMVNSGVNTFPKHSPFRLRGEP